MADRGERRVYVEEGSLPKYRSTVDEIVTNIDASLRVCYLTARAVDAFVRCDGPDELVERGERHRSLQDRLYVILGDLERLQTTLSRTATALGGGAFFDEDFEPGHADERTAGHERSLRPTSR